MSCLVGIGCEPPPPAEEVKPYARVHLTLRCPDAAFAQAITPMVRAWEVRTGGQVTIHTQAMTATDDTDIGILRSGELGEWGSQKQLLPVPVAFRGSDHPIQWFGWISAYSNPLVNWQEQTLAVPLTASGAVLVYRTAAFTDVKVPTTWEDFADVATFFAQRDKKPSLPPLPTAAEPLFDLFCQVASSMDRRALSDVEVATQAGADRDALAFQLYLSTGKSRLNSFGFQQAAQWLERLRHAQALATVPPGGSDDPVLALVEQRAVMAVLSLEQLARLAPLAREKNEDVGKWGLANVPGARHYVGAPEKSPPTNYVPYFSGGRLGVVRARCPHPEAAFDLLADLASPARTAEYVATPGLGAGPVRVAHFDRERLLLWMSYGFDEDRTKTLQDAMRHCVNQAVKNPTYELRVPQRRALVEAAARHLRTIGTEQTAEVALQRLEAEWNQLLSQD
ncbi:MAG: extracellular solute-binding protein [Gemmataceae bacterium]|nr:extracellular solute-binding protein [Gemmataceae bacterium]